MTAPGLLLLDEPLASLDAATRSQVRTDLLHHLVEFAGACVLVTHDPLDAMVLADDVVVVEDGRAVQQGTPSEVARSPRTDYVARLVGLNLLRGTLTGHDVALEAGGVLSAATGEAGAAVPQGPVLVAFAPAAVALSAQRPGRSSPRNVWACTVAATERHGETVRVRLDGAPPVLVDVTAAAVAELGLRPGEPVWASLKATEVTVYPAGGQPSAEDVLGGEARPGQRREHGDVRALQDGVEPEAVPGHRVAEHVRDVEPAVGEQPRVQPADLRDLPEHLCDHGEGDRGGHRPDGDVGEVDTNSPTVPRPTRDTVT